MHAESTSRELVDVRQAAERINVSPKTIRKWIRNGTLRAYRVGPSMIRLDTADIDSLVQAVK